MICNKEMKELIDKLNDNDKLVAKIDLNMFTNILFPQFVELSNIYKEMYYVIDSNYNPVNEENGEELCWSEWDINEERVTLEENSILKVTKIGLIITKVWNQTLNEKYPGKEFDIVLSIDKGQPVDDEANYVSPSATLRFYHVREGFHVCSDIEKFAQPVLVQSTLF